MRNQIVNVLYHKLIANVLYHKMIANLLCQQKYLQYNLFVKRRRILVTCSRRFENPAGLRLFPSLPLFSFSEILVMQMEGQPPLGRPPRYRAAWGAGRPAAGRPVFQGL